MVELKVDLGQRSYPIFIGTGLLTDPNCFLPWIRGRQVAIVTNATVAAHYLSSLKSVLADHDPTVIMLPDGEQYKNLTTLNRIFDQLLQERHSRQTTLVALGGGVIGDMAGFAAACYQRGVDFIQAPTTLLAQVDSSVGGKTGVNHALGKNMIGAFYQPNVVVIDTSTLNTLADRELAAGLAEMIKYGLIGDPPFYQWLRANTGRLIARDPEAMSWAIQRSCQNKARIVVADETESGLRALLNYGHTFGHAIEAHTGFSAWLHGEAVAVGMVMAADLSRREGFIANSDVEHLVDLLAEFNLPVTPPAGLSPEDFMRLMAVDKKVVDGQLRLVLLKSIGNAIISDTFDPHNLRDCLNHYCS